MRMNLISLMFLAIMGTLTVFEYAGARTFEVTINESEYVDRIETYSNGVLTLRTEIFIAVEDGLHYTRLSDDIGIISEVLSLPAHIAQYEANKAAIELANAKFQSEQNLIGEIAPGEVITQWVANRTVELQQCELDAINALALGSWTALGTGQQNAVIASLLTCQEINSRVNRKTINALEDILRTEGIID